MPGEIKKLKIQAYSDEKYQNEIGAPEGVFEVLFNPEKIEDSFSVKLKDEKAAGKNAKSKSYWLSEPGDFNLKIWLDGTGLAAPKVGKTDKKEGGLGPDTDGKRGESVIDQLERLKKVAYHMNGETHEPNYISILWGNLLVKGRLINLRVTYTLFGIDGRPLRATADLTVSRTISKEEAEKRANKSSPDLTHLRTANGTNPLPLMTRSIYGQTTWYMEVARVNELDTIMRIPPGKELRFPPIDKSTR